MDNIGRLIRRFRLLKGLTQNELAEGLCSSKYIYYIEKEQRYPSINILRGIMNKLNVDLFEYFPYLDSEAPILVKEMMDEFSRCSQNSDLSGLERAITRAEKLNDFSTEPWINEVNFYKSSLVLKGNGDKEKAYETIKENIIMHGGVISFGERDLRNATRILIRYYNLQSMYYGLIEDFEKATLQYKYLYEELRSRNEIGTYQAIYISVTMNYINCLYATETYNKMLEIGEELIIYMCSIPSTDRLHVVYYLMTLCNSKLGHIEIARDYARKCMYLGLGLNKIYDLNIFTDDDSLNQFVFDGSFIVNLKEQIN